MEIIFDITKTEWVEEWEPLLHPKSYNTSTSIDEDGYPYPYTTESTENK